VEGQKDKVKEGENMEFNIEIRSIQVTVFETEPSSTKKIYFI